MHKRTAFLAALLCICSLPALASDLELVANGDFELDLSTGWEQSIAGDALFIQRATNLDVDPDYETRVYCNDGHGNAKVWQTMVLPSLDTVFTADLKTRAVDGSGAWCAAGLMISYMDGNSSVLGKTFLGSTGNACPWTSADDFHVIPLTYTWATQSFVIGDELANLPAVDPSDVVKMEVALLVTAANC